MPDLKDKVIAASRDVDPNTSDSPSQVWDTLRIQFEQNPNPMLPWTVLIWARHSGSDVPGWVLDYFHDKALVLTEIVTRRRAPENAKKEAREVARALGFGAGGKGHRSAGAKLNQQWRDFDLAVRIADRMRQDLLRQGVAKETAAIEETAKDRRVSTPMARRAHIAFGDIAARFVFHGMRIS